MLAASRKDFLVERLARDGRIVAKDIANELGISEDSVRRDLRELDAAGLAVRVYGGALPASPAVVNYAARTSVALDSKRRVAKAASALIEPGSTVILDGGTTSMAMVDWIPKSLGCTIITHSPTVASALLDHAASVFLIGGQLFKHSAVASGAAAAEAASKVTADVFFLGVTGVHPTAGLTTGDPDEAAMKRVLATRAADTYVLASSEKVGAVSRYDVLSFEAIAGIITDADATEPTMRELAEEGIRILGA